MAIDQTGISTSFNTSGLSKPSDGSPYYLAVTISEKYGVSENTSTITLTAKVAGGNGSSYYAYLYDNSISITNQDGTSVYSATKAKTLFYNGDTIWSITFNTAHASDGTGSLSISMSSGFASSSRVSKVTNKAVALTTIPRASSFTLSSASISTVGSTNIVISAASTSFTHNVTTTYSGMSYTLASGISAGTTALNFNNSSSTSNFYKIRAAMATNSTKSITLTLTLTTYNGSTAIGTTTGTLTLTAPKATVAMESSSVECTATNKWTLSTTDTVTCRYTVYRTYSGTKYNNANDTTKATTTTSTPANTWFQTLMDSVPSGSITTTVITYVGDTEVGSSTTTYTVTIPTSTYYWKVSNDTVTHNKTVDTSKVSPYAIAGLETVTVKFSYAAQNSTSSEYSSYIVSCDNATIGANLTKSIDTTNKKITVTTSVLPESISGYKFKISCTINDSRGTPNSVTTDDISVTGYVRPQITASASRVNSSGKADSIGTYANLTASATATTATMSSVVIKYGSTTVASGTSSASVSTYGGSFSLTTQYTFTVTATDSFGQATTYTLTLPKAKYEFSLYPGGGGAFGTPATSNTFQVTYPSVISNSLSAELLQNAYITTHGESNMTIIPFINNDIAHLLKRGGSATVTYDGTAQSVDLTNCFDGSGSYWNINPSSLSLTTLVIELTLHTTYNYTSTVYIDFGNASWRAKSITIDVYQNTSASWNTIGSTTSNSRSFYYAKVSAGTDSISKIRLTLSSWGTSNIFRIAQIGLINYSSVGARQPYMSRGNDDFVFRSITPASTNTYSLGSSSYKWANVYATTFTGALSGNATTATTATTATKLGSATVGSTSQPIYLNTGTATAIPQPTSGNWFRGIPSISSGGVVEIGRYIDFHPTSASTLDFSKRIDAGTGTTPRTLTLPDKTGTFALEPILLYSVTSGGNTGTITLNEAVENFSYVRIDYLSGGLHSKTALVELLSTPVGLLAIEYTGSVIWVRYCKLTLSGTSGTFSNSIQYAIYGSGSTSTTNGIYLRRIWGFR